MDEEQDNSCFLKVLEAIFDKPAQIGPLLMAPIEMTTFRARGQNWVALSCLKVIIAHADVTNEW